MSFVLKAQNQHTKTPTHKQNFIMYGMLGVEMCWQGGRGGDVFSCMLRKIV